MNFNYNYNNSDIMHWGVKGMKWGVITKPIKAATKKIGFRKTQSKKDKSYDINKKQKDKKPDKQKDNEHNKENNNQHNRRNIDPNSGSNYDKLSKHSTLALQNSIKAAEKITQKDIGSIEIPKTKRTLNDVTDTIGALTYSTASVLNVIDAYKKAFPQKRDMVQEATDRIFNHGLEDAIKSYMGMKGKGGNIQTPEYFKDPAMQARITDIAGASKKRFIGK